MSITVLLPVVDAHDITDECINHLVTYAETEIEIIVIDNDSAKPYTNDKWYMPPHYNSISIHVIRNDQNKGVYASYLQGMEAASNNLVFWMHNDVLIHEQGWDTRIIAEFEKDPLLGIAGFFGGRGVGEDGGRMHPESNLLGKVWGQNIAIHGHLLTDTHPAVVFDSLAMILRRDIFNKIEVPYVAPHHWFDRIMTLWFVDKGYHALTIGIGYDHMGGGTSVGHNNRHSEFVQRWCESMGLPLDQNWDMTLYNYGKDFFQRTWKGKFPVMVDKNFHVTWGTNNADDD